MCWFTIDLGLSLHVTVISDRTILCQKIVSLRKLHTINNMVKLLHRSIRFRSFFDLIVKKYEINKSQKCTPFWHKKINVQNRVLFWGSTPGPAGELTTLPSPPSRKGLLAFG